MLTREGIALTIRTHRILQELSQHELASRSNMTQSRLARIEAKKSEPKLTELADLALALGLKDTELLEDMKRLSKRGKKNAINALSS